MAVAFGAEGEGEGVETGLPALVREWRDEEHIEVGAFAVVLSHCRDAVQLIVSALPPTDHQFKGAFDNERLSKAGFGDSVSFENRVKIIIGALKRDLGMTATLKPDGSGLKLHLKVPMLFFEAAYNLPLKREQLSESHVLSAKLLQSEQHLAESQARVAEMHKIIEELMEASKVMEAEMAKVKTELSTAASDCEAAKKLLAAAKVQYVDARNREQMESAKAMEDEMAKMKKQLAAASAELESMAAEIRVRDERIAEFELKESMGLPTAAGTSKSVHPPTDFRFDTTLTKGATDPSRFQVSTDGKTATEKDEDYDIDFSQLMLTPNVVKGMDSVVFRLENVGCEMGVGVTDDCGELLWDSGCVFFGYGDIYVNGETVTVSSPFSDLQKGDEIKLIVDLDNGKVIIETRKGQHTADWKPRTGRRTWIGFQSVGGGLTIV